MIRNVLILMTDQHSREGLGCYGNSWMRTPNLDRMSGEGVIFENAYCPAPLCAPSRMSFLSGDYPSTNGVWDNLQLQEHRGDSWLQALTRSGVKADLIGRMHFTGEDQVGAFGRRILGEISAAPPGTPLDHPYLWKTLPRDTTDQMRIGVEHSGTGDSFYQWFDEVVAEKTCEYLKCQAKDGGPFVAVSGMVLPHCPFIAPEDLFEYYWEAAPEVSPGMDFPEAYRTYLEDRELLDPPVSPARKKIARAAYFALCELVDRNVGTILNTLEETGLDESTLVIYTSDHGEMAGHKEGWWKSCFYEPSVGIPLLMRAPRGTFPARSISEVCNLIDLGPTALDLLGVSSLRSCDGRSLRPLLENRAADWPEETFSEFVEVKTEGYWRAARMIRSGPWKLWEYVDSRGQPPALFHLEEDPEEERDLWGDPEFLELGEALRQRLHQDWDPDKALRESKRLHEEFISLRKKIEKDPIPAPYQLIPPRIDREQQINTQEHRLES